MLIGFDNNVGPSRNVTTCSIHGLTDALAAEALGVTSFAPLSGFLFHHKPRRPTSLSSKRMADRTLLQKDFQNGSPADGLRAAQAIVQRAYAFAWKSRSRRD
jgi:hypothetical protein